jgi:hypothetical protein
MPRSRLLIALVVLLAVPGGVGAGGNGKGRGHEGPDRKGHGRPTPVACPTDVAAALAERCPCDAGNHGRYVSCVARFRNALRKADCLTRDTWGSLVRCAAQSTCGKKEGAVVCCVATTGTCDDPVPGDLTADGVCSNDPELACDSDADCTKIRARVARSEAVCTANGGTAVGEGSVCGACSMSTTTTTTTTSSTTTSTTETSSTETSSTTTTTTLPLVYGNAAEFPGSSSHTPDYLLGSAVHVPLSATLTHLSVIAKSAGSRVVLALYSDSGGEPDQLVAATPATTMSVGANEIPVTPTLLSAGTYWIMGVYETDASIGFDETDTGAVVYYLYNPFADPLPASIEWPSLYLGHRFNYYLNVLE